MAKQEPPMRIWVELDKTGNALMNKKRAELASKMLERLGCEPKTIWWHDSRGCYCVGTTSYYEMSDNGHWFNLETLAGAPAENIADEAAAPKQP